MIAFVAAVEQPNNPDWGKAGPVALFVLMAFVVACFFLFRSMSRQLRKVPPSFERTVQPEEQRLGTAKAAIPPREGDDSYAARGGGSAPKLGTPDDLLGSSGGSAGRSPDAAARGARREQIRRAKTRQREAAAKRRGK